MNRRAFLETVTAASAGLIVGAEALDVWDRLTWRRKYWAGADVPREEWLTIIWSGSTPFNTFKQRVRGVWHGNTLVADVVTPGPNYAHPLVTLHIA